MTTMPVTIQERIPMPLDVAARPSTALTAGDVIRILRQRIFLILFIWMTVVGAAASLTYWLARTYPLYKAQAPVFVESPFPKTPFQIGQQMVNVDVMDRFVSEQAVMLTNETVLSETLRDAALRATSWFQSQKEPKETNALAELKDKLTAKQVPDTGFIVVSFATRAPEDAPVVVNTVINKYLAQVKNLSLEQYNVELQDYQTTQDALDKQLKRIRSDKETFITTELGAPGVTEGLNVIGETWRAYSDRVAEYEAQKLLHQAAYENLLAADPTQLAISPENRLMIQEDPQIRGLTDALTNIRQALLVLDQQGFGASHRQIRDLQAQASVLEEQLLQLTAEKEQEVRDYQINQVRTLYLNATQAEIQLRERMMEFEAKQRDLDRGLARYRSLEEEQKLLEEQFSRVNEYMNQLRMIVNARGMLRVRPIGTAVKPDKRHFPRWEYNIPAGAFLGLVLGVGLAMFLELIDTSVKTSRDVVRYVHLPILGTVPDVDDEEVDIDQVELASHTSPRSMIAEAFRIIRTNLLLSSPAERQRSVVVTSAKPEEGKTAVACNLAISIAQSGRRILLVDANFHRPTLHRLFRNMRREGLSNVLVGQAKLSDLVNRTELPNLDVLTAGPTPPNPTELLAGPYLRDMINQATQLYDQIIFDAPPVLLVSDVPAMSTIVDGVVLVCRAKSTSRGTIVRAREQLERVDGHIFGAVLNAAQVTRGGYFREQIRTYYDYQAAAALDAESTRALPDGDQAQQSDDA